MDQLRTAVSSHFTAINRAAAEQKARDAPIANVDVGTKKLLPAFSTGIDHSDDEDNEHMYPTPLPSSTLNNVENPSSPVHVHREGGRERVDSNSQFTPFFDRDQQNSTNLTFAPPSAQQHSFTLRCPLSDVALVRVPTSGKKVTIGRSKNRSDVVISRTNKLISRRHGCLFSGICAKTNAYQINIECHGWNGLDVCSADGLSKDTFVGRGQTYTLDYVPGTTLMVHGQRVLIELVDENVNDETEEEFDRTQDAISSPPCLEPEVPFDSVLGTGFDSNKENVLMLRETEHNALMSPLSSPVLSASADNSELDSRYATPLPQVREQASEPRGVLRVLQNRDHEQDIITPSPADSAQHHAQLLGSPMVTPVCIADQPNVDLNQKNKDVDSSRSASVSPCKGPEISRVVQSDLDPTNVSLSSLSPLSPSPVAFSPSDSHSESHSEPFASPKTPSRSSADKSSEKTEKKDKNIDKKMEAENKPEKRARDSKKDAKPNGNITDSLKKPVKGKKMAEPSEEKQDTDCDKENGKPSKRRRLFDDDETGEDITTQEEAHEIAHVVANHLAFSRLSQTPLSYLCRNIGALAHINKTSLRQVLEQVPWIGVIHRAGKDAAGKPLEEEYYYIAESDQDESRRFLVQQARGGTSLRSCRRTHKQYFWKKPAAK